MTPLCVTNNTLLVCWMNVKQDTSVHLRPLNEHILLEKQVTLFSLEELK